MYYEDGYYWARMPASLCPGEGGYTHFVVYREAGAWFCCGVHNAIDFDPAQIVHKIPEPMH